MKVCQSNWQAFPWMTSSASSVRVLPFQMATKAQENPRLHILEPRCRWHTRPPGFLGSGLPVFTIAFVSFLPVPENDRGVITFRGLYGDYYQYLLDAAHRVEFRFLTDAFDEFVMRDWPGLLRGQHRIVPQTMRGEKRWIPAL
jgi:hypothetical protein